MPPLATDLRRKLENVVIQARDLAEAAASAALKRWAVDEAEPFDHFSAADKAFRNRLRARGRQAGDRRDEAKKTQDIDRLTEELAYEYWHRMLFSRFLAENHLLMHPDGVAVTLAECEELAQSENAANGYVLAARYASRMLPEIFRIDDVLLDVEFPINDRLPLERKLAELSPVTFLSDDSLGWVYQFWQKKKKEEVDKSNQKIEARTLSAVTQLFTEHYMVEFLLHNTIGAWWCARNGITGPPGGAGVPEAKCPVRLDYLRWKDDGTPAAGAFAGWPKTLKEFTMLDPCCGSGHFLVAAFNLLVPLRMREEGLSAAGAVDAVLRENLHGLELDPRCTQIAAFALAMAAWKTLGDDGRPLGYRPLPKLNIACSGQGVVGSKADWIKFANGDRRFREGMERLYDLFQKAPTLGSLIDPRTIVDDLFALGFDTLRGTLDRALTKIESQSDPDRSSVGVAAQGIAMAASLMAREFAMVATNVPYLGSGKQSDEMIIHLDEYFTAGRSDLSTAFVLRCIDLCKPGGTAALVTPQNWLFLTTFTKLRRKLLTDCTWNAVIRLGSNAFQIMNWWAATTALLAITAEKPCDSSKMFGIDVSGDKAQEAKAARLANRDPTPLQVVLQTDQLKNPDAAIKLEDHFVTSYLGDYAKCLAGILNGDSPKFRRFFWEFSRRPPEWVFQQSTVETTSEYSGREGLIYFDELGGHLREDEAIRRDKLHDSDRRGNAAWGKMGVGVSQMHSLPVSLYTGDKFDSSVAVILPFDQTHVPALWSYCSSPQFRIEIRKVNQKVSVENGYITKIPFDLTYWQTVADEEYPDGLPEPQSDDPTQWLFKGHPKHSTDPLQVAVARLLGYRWPDQESDSLDCLADADGIVPIPAVRHEAPAADRFRDVLRAAFGSDWSASMEDKLLVESSAKSGTSLDDWLRNSFFDQHCKRFHNRPFIWHLWDGRKDGFACLVNYHKLDHKRLESLTYSYLQDWITIQAAGAKSSQTGADLRLAAAQELQDKLKLILAGEPPYDIFVRWKPFSEQPIGWNPDLNDGVRLNIRPFMTAGILRKNPNIKWTKDRGTEPKREKYDYPWFWKGDTFVGERVNDVHLTNAEKQAARDVALSR